MSEHNSHGNSLVVTRQFDDLDRFAEAIKPLNVTVNQLTPGGFLGTINFADFGNLKFIHFNQNEALRATGPKYSDDLLFTLTLQPHQTQVISHGCLVKKYDIFGFDSSREVDIITDKDSHIVLSSVNVQAFQSLSEQMGYELGQKFIQQNFIRLHPSSLRSVRGYYQQITQIFSSQPSLLMQSKMQSLIMEDFLPLLINTVGKSAQKKQRIVKPFRRYSLVKKAEEIARSYRDKPLTLQKLCEELDTSSSALCYGFQEIFGISPMEYIKVQRLNGVRRSLINDNPNTTTVMQVAHKWGFWNAGHFSRDYQEMFGELPSKTLQSH